MIIPSIAFFCFGSIVGSFLNTVIYRVPRHESLLFPFSYCPQCGEKIHFWDNIPIISFLILGGRCRYCKKPIPLRYFLVELLTAFLFMISYFKYGLSYELIFFAFLAFILVILTFTDLEKRRIPNSVVIAGIFFGLYMSLIFWPLAFIDSLLGFLVGCVMLLFWAVMGKLIFGKESLGCGDIKLAAMIGIFLGARDILLALFLGFLLATVGGVLLILMRRLRWDSRMPFAPFLAAGSLGTLFLGNSIFAWYGKLLG